MPCEKIVSGNKQKRTKYGYRTDGVYYQREEIDKEMLRNILLAISNEVGLEIPGGAKTLRPISEILPEQIGEG